MCACIQCIHAYKHVRCTYALWDKFGLLQSKIHQVWVTDKSALCEVQGKKQMWWEALLQLQQAITSPSCMTYQITAIGVAHCETPQDFCCWTLCYAMYFFLSLSILLLFSISTQSTVTWLYRVTIVLLWQPLYVWPEYHPWLGTHCLNCKWGSSY